MVKITTIFIIALLIGGCDTGANQKEHEARVKLVGEMLDEELTDGLALNEVKEFFDSKDAKYKSEEGCVGNLGLSESACSMGKTYSGRIPIPGNKETANVYIFVHDERGLLSYQYVLSYAK